MEPSTITWSALIALLSDDEAAVKKSDPICEQYRAWAKLSIEKDFMRYLGRLVPDDGTPLERMESYPGDYWAPDAPFALAYYPYNGCDVYQLMDYPSYYLVYTEYGGHFPELRARHVRKDLLRLDDGPPAQASAE